jgi:DNA-binding transcriptional ArsR family regulator
VYGMLARDSEARHAVGAENELPDISEYSRGQAGYFGIYSVRQKKLIQRGRTFYIGTLRDQQEKIIARRDPAARPALEGAGEVTAPAPAAPQEQPGSGLRERLAHVRELNEGHPLPAGATLGAVLPPIPGVPPEIAAGLVRLLAGGPLPASAAGQPLGMSKSAAHRYLAALRGAGVVETTGTGRAIKWRLVRAAPAAASPQPYTTIEALAQLVHDGLVDATDEQREVLEQAWQVGHRPHLTVVQGGGGGAP